VITANYS